MKKSVLFAVAILFSALAFSQPNNVLNAYNELKAGRLDKALNYIELAKVHVKTMGEPKTWLYRGNIYLSIAATEETKYKALCADPLDSAYNSYQKSIAIDKEFIAPAANPASAKQGLMLLGNLYYNKGVEFYNIKDYTNSKRYFERTKSIKNTFGEKDSLSTFHATRCALNLGDKETAMKYLKELITMDYQNPDVYSMLGVLYQEAGDTVKSINTIKSGRKRFPNDLGLVKAEANYYMAKGDYATAISMISGAATGSDPKVYFTVGVVFDEFLKDSTLTTAIKDSMMLESEKAYKKTIELDPKFFDAYYNLGALFFNRGVEYFNYAQDNVLSDKEYRDVEAKFKSYWNQSLPYLEKAIEIIPDDMPTLQTLKILYARLTMPEKLQTVTDKINSLKK